MTDEDPPVVGVPVMAPVVGLIDRPAGRPLADQVRVAPTWVSVAELPSPAMAVPEVDVWVAWPLTVTLSVIVQVNDVVPENPALSVALTVTEVVPPVVGVPVMVPVVGLIDRSGGQAG